VQRGDVIQLQATMFTGPGGARFGTSDKHTAVVSSISGSRLTLVEQNWNNLRAVKQNTYDYSWPHTGNYYVYRAQ
jgi:hypothetical protein